MEPIRVLIVDDNFVVRRGLRSSLEPEADTVVVADAADGLEAVRLAEELLPEVVLMDVRMPGLDGIAATRRLNEVAPGVRVLVLTWSEDVQYLIDAVLAGAKGYLVHGTFTPEDLVKAVHTIHSGGALITPSLASGLLDFVRNPSSSPGLAERPLTDPALSVLSPREVEVLDLVRAGLSNRIIAERLVITDKTVKNHINNIYSKLNLCNRYEAIVSGIKPRDL